MIFYSYIYIGWKDGSVVSVVVYKDTYKFIQEFLKKIVQKPGTFPMPLNTMLTSVIVE